MPDGVEAESPALLPGMSIQVRKLRPDGTEKLSWTGLVLESDASCLVVVAEYGPLEVAIGDTVIRQGDVFTEFYYWDPGHWFTIAQVSDPLGSRKGWYCDVCMPPYVDDAGVVTYVDLDLDLWRDADGTIVLLDEDEFAEHAAAGHFTLAQIDGAKRGWAELRAIAEQDVLPRR